MVVTRVEYTHIPPISTRIQHTYRRGTVRRVVLEQTQRIYICASLASYLPGEVAAMGDARHQANDISSFALGRDHVFDPAEQERTELRIVRDELGTAARGGAEPLRAVIMVLQGSFNDRGALLTAEHIVDREARAGPFLVGRSVSCAGERLREREWVYVCVRRGVHAQACGRPEHPRGARDIVPLSEACLFVRCFRQWPYSSPYLRNIALRGQTRRPGQPTSLRAPQRS